MSIFQRVEHNNYDFLLDVREFFGKPRVVVGLVESTGRLRTNCEMSPSYFPRDNLF